MLEDSAIEYYGYDRRLGTLAATTTVQEEPTVVVSSGLEGFVESGLGVARFTVRARESTWHKDFWCLLMHARNELVHLPDLELSEEELGYFEDTTLSQIPRPELSRAPRTELGRRLRELRQRIVASGQALLDWDELDREMQQRRGERVAEDAP